MADNFRCYGIEYGGRGKYTVEECEWLDAALRAVHLVNPIEVVISGNSAGGENG